MPLAGTKVNPTQEDIIRTLDTIRNQRDRRTGYFNAQPYRNYMPDTQLPGFQARDTQQYGQNLQGINQIGKNATELSLVIAQNKAALEAEKQAAKKKRFSSKQLEATAAAQAGVSSAANNAPLKPVKGFNIHAPIVTRKWHGYSLTMNASVIPRFTGFLDALAATGYKIKSIGTYANRNIAGTNVKSLHSLGLAMDINPSQNPVTWNGHNITNLPPGVGALAARYGIKWGGSWVHSKRDPMHFSVPYGGRM